MLLSSLREHRAERAPPISGVSDDREERCEETTEGGDEQRNIGLERECSHEETLRHAACGARRSSDLIPRDRSPARISVTLQMCRAWPHAIVTFAGSTRALGLTLRQAERASLSTSDHLSAGLATLGIEGSDMAIATEAPASGLTFPGVSDSVSDESELFATTVHELRSPLTTISGQVQMARRFVAKDPAREREALGVALAQVARMDRLLDELVDLSHALSNQSPREEVIFDLRDVVADAIRRHESDDVPHITNRSPNERVDVRGDADRIGRILDNLLDNALKYSPAGAPIEVALFVLGPEAQVHVEDHGVGIPDDARDHLFSRYYRSARTRNIPGTGLGLHISRCVAEQHGGRLWLERSTEMGSTFALALPLAVGEQPNTAAPA